MKIRFTELAALFLIPAAAQLAYSAGAITPEKLDGAEIVSADQVKDLMSKGVKVFDVRVAYEYKEEHIDGAVSVPYKEKSKKAVDFDAKEDQFDLKTLPKEGMVFHCNGPECWKSYKASVLAIKDGRKKVYWFRGGMPEWKSKGFPVAK